MERCPEDRLLTVAEAAELLNASPRFPRRLIGERRIRFVRVDLAARTVRVVRQLAEVRGAGFAFGLPKSRAGIRVVPIPTVIVPIIRWYLSCFAQPGEEGLVFTSPGASPLHHSNFRVRVWLPALRAAGLTGLHFHDLRYTGNTLAATAGATLPELMDRMGTTANGPP